MASRSNHSLSAISLQPVTAPRHLVKVVYVAGQLVVHGLGGGHGGLAVVYGVLLDGTLLGHRLKGRACTACPNRIRTRNFQKSNSISLTNRRLPQCVLPASYQQAYKLEGSIEQASYPI